jgi:hypothetical protein
MRQLQEERFVRQLMEGISRLRQVWRRSGKRLQRDSRKSVLPPQLPGKLECDQSAQTVSIQDVRPIEVRLEFNGQNLCHPTDLSEGRFAEAIFSARQLNRTDVDDWRQRIFPRGKLRSAAAGMGKAKKPTTSIWSYPLAIDPWSWFGEHHSGAAGVIVSKGPRGSINSAVLPFCNS